MARSSVNVTLVVAILYTYYHTSCSSPGLSGEDCWARGKPLENLCITCVIVVKILHPLYIGGRSYKYHKKWLTQPPNGPKIRSKKLEV